MRPFPRKEKFNLSPLICIAFTQGFRIFQSFGHPTLGSEGKKTFKWYLRKGTDWRAYGHTHKRTNQLIDWSGPEGQFSENCKKKLLRGDKIHVFVWKILSDFFELCWKQICDEKLVWQRKKNDTKQTKQKIEEKNY